MYCIIVKTELKQGSRKKFLDAMLPYAEVSVRDEPGCLVFNVQEMREEPNAFLLYEIYESQAAFEDHKQTDHCKTCRATVPDLIERQTVLKSDVIAMNPSR